MHVLVFSTLYPNDEQPHHGIFIERRVLELRRRSGWTFEVVAPVPWFPLRGERFGLYGRYARVPAVDERHGITVHHPRYLVIPRFGWRIAPLFLLLGAWGVMRRLVRARRFDLVDAHFAFPDGVAAVAAGRLLGLPVVVTARGSDINDSPRYLLPRLQLRAALGRAAARVAVAQPLARAMAELLGTSADSVPVVANGVDLDAFRPCDREAARARFGLSGQVVLAVGNLRRLKGQHLLIEALADMPGVTLVLAGGGEERAALEALATRLGVSARVRFLGVVAAADLPELYSAADVFALASSSEGCPNVILEAMACGVPIVATAVGAIPDMLPPEGLRLLVTERTAAALRTALVTALDDPPRREHYLSRAATSGWDAACAALMQTFETVAR
ncbi:MAG: glycosyltransferase [Gammaproteobacteria bacterium]